MTTDTVASWALAGEGYEFCNCDFGCGCNFGGFPNSADGSCQALVGMSIQRGHCGDVDLAGVKSIGILSWPGAIHEGNGRAVFVVDSAASDAQVDALAQICTGKLGGLPWELLGPTFEVIGLERDTINFSGSGVDSSIEAGESIAATGTSFTNPVTGEKHAAVVELPTGFIWTRGECGRGVFKAAAGDLSLAFDGTNWIYYNFDWSNAAAAAA